MAAHIYTTLNILVLNTTSDSLTFEITGECFQTGSRWMRVNYSSLSAGVKLRNLERNFKPGLGLFFKFWCKKKTFYWRNVTSLFRDGVSWKTWRHQGPTQILCNLLCHCVLAKQTTKWMSQWMRKSVEISAQPRLEDREGRQTPSNVNVFTAELSQIMTVRVRSFLPKQNSAFGLSFVASLTWKTEKVTV